MSAPAFIVYNVFIGKTLEWNRFPYYTQKKWVKLIQRRVWARIWQHSEDGGNKIVFNSINKHQNLQSSKSEVVGKGKILNITLFRRVFFLYKHLVSEKKHP